MCMGSTPDAPAPAPKLPEAPVTPNTGATTADQTADQRRRRMMAGQSQTSTILTSSRGVTDGAATAQKTLLGQ